MRKHLRRSVFTAIALTTTLVLTGCGGGSTDEPGGIDISTGTYHINLVAYAVPKVGFDEIIPAFRRDRGRQRHRVLPVLRGIG